MLRNGYRSQQWTVKLNDNLTQETAPVIINPYSFGQDDPYFWSC